MPPPSAPDPPEQPSGPSSSNSQALPPVSEKVIMRVLETIASSIDIDDRPMSDVYLLSRNAKEGSLPEWIRGDSFSATPNDGFCIGAAVKAKMMFEDIPPLDAVAIGLATDLDGEPAIVVTARTKAGRQFSITQHYRVGASSGDEPYTTERNVGLSASSALDRFLSYVFKGARFAETGKLG